MAIWRRREGADVRGCAIATRGSIGRVWSRGNVERSREAGEEQKEDQIRNVRVGWRGRPGAGESEKEIVLAGGGWRRRSGRRGRGRDRSGGREERRDG